MDLENKEIRIPRPKGATNLARGGLKKELNTVIIESYLQGNFPQPGIWISMLELSKLYNIPLKTIERAIQSQMQQTTIGMTDNPAQELRETQGRVLSSILTRIGNSDLLLNGLIRALYRRAIGNPGSHPLLLKELNSSISSQIKLSETSLKLLSELRTLLAEVPIEDESQSRSLSREEILNLISELDPASNPEIFKGYLTDTPSLKPIPGKDAPIQLPYNREASHEFIEGEEIPKIKPQSDPPILPQ